MRLFSLFGLLLFLAPPLFADSPDCCQKAPFFSAVPLSGPVFDLNVDTKTQTLYLLNGASNLIELMNYNGGQKSTLPTSGEPLNVPRGMDRDGLGNIYCVNRDGGNVFKINIATGVSSLFVTVPGAPGARFVYVDRTGNIYVSTDSNGIYEYSAAGALLAHIGVKGLLPLNAPCGMWKEGSDFYVCDTSNNRIVDFQETSPNSYSYPDDPIVEVTSSPSSPIRPQGLARDSAGHFYTANTQGYVMYSVRNGAWIEIERCNPADGSLDGNDQTVALDESGAVYNGTQNGLLVKMAACVPPANAGNNSEAVSKASNFMMAHKFRDEFMELRSAEMGKSLPQTQIDGLKKQFAALHRLTQDYRTRNGRADLTDSQVDQITFILDAMQKVLVPDAKNSPAQTAANAVPTTTPAPNHPLMAPIVPLLTGNPATAGNPKVLAPAVDGAYVNNQGYGNQANANPGQPATLLKVSPGAPFFTNLPEGTYGVYEQGRRAVITDPTGTAQIIIDQLSESYKMDNCTFHYKFIYQNKLIAEKDITDKTLLDLLPDSHVFIAKLTSQDRGYSPTPAPDQSFEAPVAVLVFRKVLGPQRFKIMVLTQSPGYPGFDLSASHYEFVKPQDDPNEQIVTRDEFFFPTAWRFTALAQTDNNTHLVSHYAGHQQVQVPPGAFDVLEAQLEEKLKNAVSAEFLYFGHMKLAQLYGQKFSQGPDNPYKKMARDQIKAALAQQPQAPLRNKFSGGTLYPFTFRCQVSQKTAVNGRFGFKLFRMGTSGKIRMLSDTLLDPEDADSDVNQRLNLNRGGNAGGFVNSAYPNQESVSPSGTYRVSLLQDQGSYYYGDQGNVWINRAVSPTVVGALGRVLDMGSPRILGWHPKKDLLYFMVTDNEGQGSDLWQYDARTLQQIKIGCSNGEVYLSPDGKWIFWGDGGGTAVRMTTGFNVFNVEKGVSYRLTHGFAPKYFVDWAKQP